jgi:protein-arginine kinase activator protein McsA
MQLKQELNDIQAMISTTNKDHLHKVPNKNQKVILIKLFIKNLKEN